ncbi:MAG: SirB2 family protein [Proteobacteria bacterium]|nr:SirB2 family protein [Pseudomonadota bacterium]
MTPFELLKVVHVSSAVLSIGGFALRGYWMLRGNELLQRRMAKTLPHIVDTLLLGSAIAMLFIWQTSPFSLDWLTAKVLALLLYIGLGMVALRFGKARVVRITAWLLALAVAAYIVSVALSKSALGFFA